MKIKIETAKKYKTVTAKLKNKRGRYIIMALASVFNKPPRIAKNVLQTADQLSMLRKF